MANLIDFKTIKRMWLQDSRVKKEYDFLKEEFQVAEEVIKARCRAHMTQAELAKKIGTKAPAIPRLESPVYGKVTMTMLKKVANALGCKLQIKLVPFGKSR